METTTESTGWDTLFMVDRPLGNVELASGRALAPFSRASWAAADNLLTKAARSLDEGDDDRAEGLVRRAAALAYDTHENGAPAAFAVTMMLFSEVVDALEECAEDDERWLDAALDVIDSGGDVARSAMRGVLADIRQDFEISRSETRRIDAALRGIPPRTELREQGQVPAEQLARQVTERLRVLVAYAAAFSQT